MIQLMLYRLFFFFSSRRRHTRCLSDWSSDVCSSDLWVAGAEVVGDAVLGLAVMADQSLIAGGYYHALTRPWGPNLSTDQVLGGGALWILGDIVGLPFLAAQLIQMIREDEAEAVVIDAELDAAEAAGAGRSPAALARSEEHTS